jgi:hypothetical protein
MILPPVTPKEGDITVYATGTAYTRGNIVSNSGNLYWAIDDGTSGAGAGPTQTDGDYTDNTVTWRYVRPARNTVTIVNMQNDDIFISKGNAAEASKGIAMTTTGSAINEGFSGDKAYQGAWYAIAGAAGPFTITIQEG